MVEDDEYELRSESPNDDITEHIIPADLSRLQAWNLYVSHAFSTWNARGYEFAAVWIDRQWPQKPAYQIRSNRD